MNKKSGRGSNPQSHSNKPKVSPEGTKTAGITIPPQDWETLDEIGNGNKSRGVRILLKAHARTYYASPRIPGLIVFLEKLSDDKSFPDQLRGEAEEWVDYLVSWSSEAEMNDHLSEQVIKAESAEDVSYIV